MSYIETCGYGKQLKKSLSRGVRYVACHVQVALLLSFLALHGVSGVPLGALLVVLQQLAFGCVCSSHVSGWLTSVEVFAVVPLGVSCFLSCWVGRYFVAYQNVGAQAECFLAAFGYRRPPRRARTCRVLVVGSQWHGCKCS